MEFTGQFESGAHSDENAGEKTPGRFESDSPWVIESDLRLVPDIGEAIDTRLRAAGWDGDEAWSVASAMIEVIQNAILHGNFKINREQFSTEEEYLRAKEVAIDDPRINDMNVTITMELSDKTVKFTVQDEGEAVIDLDQIRNPDLSAVTHRGLFLMREAFTEVGAEPGKLTLVRERGAGESVIK